MEAQISKSSPAPTFLLQPSPFPFVSDFASSFSFWLLLFCPCQAVLVEAQISASIHPPDSFFPFEKPALLHFHKQPWYHSVCWKTKVKLCKLQEYFPFLLPVLSKCTLDSSNKKYDWEHLYILYSELLIIVRKAQWQFRENHRDFPFTKEIVVIFIQFNKELYGDRDIARFV